MIKNIPLILLLLIFSFSKGIFASQKSLPFDKSRIELYSREKLWKGYDSDLTLNLSFDWKVFKYYTSSSKYNPPIDELQAQRSHDSGMDYAINRYFLNDKTGMPTNKKIIVILGSHSELRNSVWYKKVANLAFDLTKSGYFIVTGGGPGLMEAAHLGAYMAYYEKSELNEALSILDESSIPTDSSKKQYEMLDYWEKSRIVIKKFPRGADSLGIPTWFYGHEGANAFSTYVAKYFSNALREEKICALGFYGTIFAPGGPGTMQEAFMDAAQNGYGSYNWYSPMIFFSDLQVATDMQSLINSTTTPAYKQLKMVAKTTEASNVIKFLKMHPPIQKISLH